MLLHVVGQVVHLLEPDLRILEVVVKAESPAQPEIRLERNRLVAHEGYPVSSITRPASSSA